MAVPIDRDISHDCGKRSFHIYESRRSLASIQTLTDEQVKLDALTLQL